MASEIQLAQELLSSYPSVTSITGAGDWCFKADKCIQELGALVAKANDETTKLSQVASAQRLVSKEKSFLGKIFKSTDEKKTKSELDAIADLITSSHKYAERLQELVDVTPKTKEEQSSLVKELKLEKKELQLRKKQIAAEIKGIKTVARQKSASAGSPLTTLLAGTKYTASQRRSIRYSKERALAPHEDASSALDRQILSLDKELIRLEAFR